jgi:hypothetical protein
MTSTLLGHLSNFGSLYKQAEEIVQMACPERDAKP